MPKIITVTANTAIDLIITVDNLRKAENMVAQSSMAFAAGKGINVSKALENLLCPSIAMGFTGQATESLFSHLKSPYLQPQLITVRGDTRTNLTLHESHPKQETHIRTESFNVSSADCAKLRQQLQASVQKDDLVIFSGSLPHGCNANFYTDLINLCRQQHAITILDSSGTSLAFGIQAQPTLIKPNIHELEELVGSQLPDVPSILNAARSLITCGIKQVIVSRGKLGALAVTEDTTLSAYVELNLPDRYSAIGCGDAMVAGLAYGLLQHMQFEDMLKLGIACATANLYSLEPGRFDKTQMEALLPQIILQKPK